MNTKTALLTILIMVFALTISAQNQFSNIVAGTPQELTDQDVPSRVNISTTDAEITGSLGIGVDITTPYSYGFDTFVLAENNLRIYFNDTSNSASFPNNDWRLTANDSDNGGDNYFSIDDATAGRRIFRLEAGAPSNSLWVDAQGDIGIGTANPVVEIHVADGDSPTMRLEQNNTSGFTPQTWDVAGNETNFFIRDVTNGSALPFRIQPGNGANNALLIKDNGSVGFKPTGGSFGGINANASLDLDATDKGLQLNRLTNAARMALGTALGATEVGVIVYDTEDGALYTWDGTTWNGGITDTDNQTADVFQLNGNNLELSLEDDGVATQQVDLSSFLDNTDNQTADVFQLNGNNLELSLEDDGAATQQVDLSGFLDNTDNQQISLMVNSLNLEDGGSVDLSGYLDNTDDQTADVFQLNGTNLELSLEDDGAATQQVDLSSFLDNTDDQIADVFQLNGTNLELSLEDDGAATQQVDLSSFLDNTDDQIADVFQLNGNLLELSLEGDGMATQQVDLSGYLDNTDNQNISGSGLAGNTLTIGISGGASETVDLSSLNDPGTDDQQLTLAANTLNLEDGGSVDLSGFLDNTDNQQISLSGNLLNLEDGGNVNLSGYLDNTDNQNISGSGLAGNTLTIGISGGASQTVDLSPLSNSGTDDQQLTLVGNSLNLEDGGSVDLAGYLDNTDDQILANFILSGDQLSLAIQDGNLVSVDMAPLVQPLIDENAAQQVQIDLLLANSAAQQAIIDNLIDRLEILEDCACTTLETTEFDPTNAGRAYLYQNVPNPFGDKTSIGYYIPYEHSRANLVISTTTGQILANISIREFGEGAIEFNKSALQSAMYFYTLYVDGQKVDTKRMLVE
jgi:deferrochelatase/peroxidase EfeB